MYKHILIPTDGSELSMKAVTHGLSLAKAVGATATIIMATRMWSAMDMSEHARHGEKHPVEEYEERFARVATKVLAGCKTKADEAGVPVETQHIKDMDPDEAIVRTAADKGCDLILMASHERGPIGRMLLGSVALKVLTHTKIPVQIVR